MSSTFTAPIRIFVRNNPSNDGTIAPDNTGAAICSQQATITGGTATTIVIPAGSIISNVIAYVTTGAGTPANNNVTIDSTVVGTLNDGAGVKTISFAATSAAVSKLANVGSADVTLSVTAGASTVGTLSVEYTPRNSNGTITAYGSGYSNN